MGRYSPPLDRIDVHCIVTKYVYQGTTFWFFLPTCTFVIVQCLLLCFCVWTVAAHLRYVIQ
jgi:hypothetical protein